MCGSYTGGSAAHWALHVGRGLKNVEGNKSDLVEVILTFPPALGRLEHLFDSESRKHWVQKHRKHIPSHLMWRGWRRYLKRLPLLHWQLRAVPRYEIIHTVVESLGWNWAAISAQKVTLLFLQIWVSVTAERLISWKCRTFHHCCWCLQVGQAEEAAAAAGHTDKHDCWHGTNTTWSLLYTFIFYMSSFHMTSTLVRVRL